MPSKSTAKKAQARAQVSYGFANKTASTQNASRIAMNKAYGNKKAKPSPTRGGGRTRAI